MKEKAGLLFNTKQYDFEVSCDSLLSNGHATSTSEAIDSVRNSIASVINKSNDYCTILCTQFSNEIYGSDVVKNALSSFVNKNFKELSIICKKIPTIHSLRTISNLRLGKNNIRFHLLDNTYDIKQDFIIGDGKYLRLENDTSKRQAKYSIEDNPTDEVKTCILQCQKFAHEVIE